MNNKDLIIQALGKQGIKNKYLVFSILAVLDKETGLTPKRETSYKNTDSARLKNYIFKNALKDYTIEQVDKIKKDDKSFFNAVYGGKLGNKPNTNDSLIYRGGGYNQLTGRNNYQYYGNALKIDLVNNPDLINNPSTAADVVALFFKNGLKSGLKLGKFKGFGVDKVEDINTYERGVKTAFLINAGVGTDISTPFYTKTLLKSMELLKKYVPTNEINKGLLIIPLIIFAYLYFKH